MKKLKERKIYNWIINSLELTNDFNFISTQDLYKDYCATYNIVYEQTKVLSFSILLSNLFKKLNWEVQKHRFSSIRGYRNLKFKHNADVFSYLTIEGKLKQLHSIENKLYLEALEALDKKISKQTETIKQFLLEKDIKKS